MIPPSTTGPIDPSVDVFDPNRNLHGTGSRPTGLPPSTTGPVSQVPGTGLGKTYPEIEPPVSVVPGASDESMIPSPIPPALDPNDSAGSEQGSSSSEQPGQDLGEQSGEQSEDQQGQQSGGSSDGSQSQDESSEGSGEPVEKPVEYPAPTADPEPMPGIPPSGGDRSGDGDDPFSSGNPSGGADPFGEADPSQEPGAAPPADPIPGREPSPVVDWEAGTGSDGSGNQGGDGSGEQESGGQRGEEDELGLGRQKHRFDGTTTTVTDVESDIGAIVNPQDPDDGRQSYSFPGDQSGQQEPPRSLQDEQYDNLEENGFKLTRKQPLSTFSIDVDTASYSNVRRLLNQRRLPPSGAVRIEEMVNYFSYDYPAAEEDEAFSVSMEIGGCPWNANNRLLRVGLKGREIPKDERGATNLVFLIDVSGSMRDSKKLPLVKESMEMLVSELTEDDYVAIVTYASGTSVKLESTCAAEKNKILDVIDGLFAGGSTNGSEGIQRAYEQAMKNFVPGGTNRVILATDGDLNVGITDDDSLVEFITEKAKTGVFLTVLGYGTGNLKDSKLEKIANKGNGMYAYIDSLREARKVLVDEMAASLVTIAKDVKIQVDFNFALVEAYRLIGYENRMLAAKDFDDDKKDAGEIGAGHTVTALYEIVPPRKERAASTSKYQQIPEDLMTVAAKSGEMATLKLRYKEPDGEKSRLIERPVKDEGKQFGEASKDFRFASAVASFGMVLRGSRHARHLSLAAVEEFAAGAIGSDEGGLRSEFIELIQLARQLTGR